MADCPFGEIGESVSLLLHSQSYEKSEKGGQVTR